MSFEDTVKELNQQDSKICVILSKIIGGYKRLDITVPVPKYLAKENGNLNEALIVRGRLLNKLFELITIPSDTIVYAKIITDDKITNLLNARNFLIKERVEKRKKIKSIDKVGIIRLFNQNTDVLTKEDFIAIEKIIRSKIKDN